MIKRMSLVIAIMISVVELIALSILLVAVTQQAQADSLECQYRGQFLTYTEVEKSDDPNGVKSVYINEAMSRIIFHNDKEYRYGSIIPCVMIKHDADKTKFLEEYQSQFE